MGETTCRCSEPKGQGYNQMKHMLRKTSINISINYTNGNFSNNLTGTDFSLDDSDDKITLSINLATNLRVKNKTLNCYADACDLANDHFMLDQLQIYDEQVIKDIVAAKKKNSDAVWMLYLLLGEKGKFECSVMPTISNGSLFLNVQ